MLKLSEIQTITQAEGLFSTPELEVSGISTDTRTLKGGELFIPCGGENTTGRISWKRLSAKVRPQFW
jgi:hypothetical protein